MFRIRRIHDDTTPANRRAIESVRRILLERFTPLSEKKIDKFLDMLRRPPAAGFSPIVFVAEGFGGAVKGAALVSYDPDLRFCYLDYLAAAVLSAGRGIGDALYRRVREEALILGAVGIFFECLPDDPALSRNPDILRGNRARLRFYEAYGARPVIDTKYETPLKPGGDNPPYLVFDGLDRGEPLRRDFARDVAATILSRKYGQYCTPEYIRMVVESFRDDPVKIRPPRYVREERTEQMPVSDHFQKIALVVTDQHEIHHVRDRGYIESPVRIRAITAKIIPTGLFELIPPREFAESHVREVHDAGYLNYFKRVTSTIPPDEPVYAYVFPLRNRANPPRELAYRAGYYCIDVFTPLSRNAYIAARRAVDCAMTAATEILGGRRLAYALVRPPGHHAERQAFGGFCYFNNAAVAAHFLSGYGTVAILDIDYHHGNGQQMIFYRRRDVLTVSIHGEPAVAYPYFSGFAHERGEGEGLGYNRNYPCPEHMDGERYLKTFDAACADVRRFRPSYLIVCVGLDTAKGDPTGSWSLVRSDYRAIGERIASLGLPTLVVQEGGYYNRSIGTNAREFFGGLWNGVFRGRK
jgi:acetoin utilization deacetylase AcuC-like enzyme/GNAT superfamily N-acetyltransferase